jgi:hypothetical protein
LSAGFNKLTISRSWVILSEWEFREAKFPSSRKPPCAESKGIADAL